MREIKEAGSPDRVLIITGGATIGGTMNNNKASVIESVRRQLSIAKTSSGPWLDFAVKAVSAELLTARKLFKLTPKYRRASYRQTVERFFGNAAFFESPELTEVVIAGLLEDAGLEWEATTFAELNDPVERERLLARCKCVMMSTTLMRDLNETLAMVDMIKRPDNRIVLGGALVSLIHNEWPVTPKVDVVAVGYGEMLVPAIAAWVHSGYRSIPAPIRGEVKVQNGTTIVYSGVPISKSLDWMPTPDWKLAERYHGRKFAMVNYESVRGCPYRCAFCNYPFLFADSKFRTKSAEQIAKDWLGYAEQGAEFINCLDSLFTIPPVRLRELCKLLIEAGSPISWSCYARASDLAKLENTRLMKEAGCRMVQIGIESGAQVILDNMNKRCKVRDNAQALENCRKVGLTAAITLIVGFPGETEQTIKDTVRMLKDSPPDSFFAGCFNTRMEAMPILKPEARAKHGLEFQRNHESALPYWRHNTMSCERAPQLLRWLNHELMAEGVGLEGSIFYSGMHNYNVADRPQLLAFQKDILKNARFVSPIFPKVQQLLAERIRSGMESALREPMPEAPACELPKPEKAPQEQLVKLSGPRKPKPRPTSTTS